VLVVAGWFTRANVALAGGAAGSCAPFALQPVKDSAAMLATKSD
jgi:hypothetical protein